MEIIIATIGLSSGILTQAMFSMIVLMAMATSLMAPFALRWVLRRVTQDPEEIDRLRREDLAKGSLVGRVHRVLLPVRRRPDRAGSVQTIESLLLSRLGGRKPVAITLLNVCPPGEREVSARYLDESAGLFQGPEIQKRVVKGGEPGQRILDEAQEVYELILLGAPEGRTDSESLFNPVVDLIVRASPCPTLVVKGLPTDGSWPPKRFVVPSNGSAASKPAAEFEFAPASGAEDKVTILNVVIPGAAIYRLEERELGIAQRIVDELRSLGESSGVRTETDVRVGRDPESVILKLAKKSDLILLGTDRRLGSDRLFLGPRVERILVHAPCPVVVINAS